MHRQALETCAPEPPAPADLPDDPGERQDVRRCAHQPDHQLASHCSCRRQFPGRGHGQPDHAERDCACGRRLPAPHGSRCITARKTSHDDSARFCLNELTTRLAITAADSTACAAASPVADASGRRQHTPNGLQIARQVLPAWQRACCTARVMLSSPMVPPLPMLPPGVAART